MSPDRLNNINIVSEEPLSSPAEIKSALPLKPKEEQFIFESRETVRNILDHKDPRLLLIAGPCSIHNIDAGLEYAKRLLELSKELNDVFFIIMRVYFEKPRTAVGWKGLINDPLMDDSFRIEDGLRMARGFLLNVAAMGLPAGTEVLDPIVPQYIGDLISWSAIGARTSESQTHREIASGLSSPIGFKNGTDGNIELAINAIRSAQNPHHFLGINQEGLTTVFRTRGNSYAHLILRGGIRPNYDRANIAYCQERLKEANLPMRILIDCSHGNSNRVPENQVKVLNDGIKQIVEGNKSIIGFMLESNLESGSQPISSDPSRLQPGISVTDACLGWKETKQALVEGAQKLRGVIGSRFR